MNEKPARKSIWYLIFLSRFYCRKGEKRNGINYQRKRSVKCFWMYELILSILVDTFISKISLPMQPVPEIGSISVA